MSTYRRLKEDQNAWDIFLSVLFAALLILSSSILLERGGYPWRVNVFDAILMSLAVFRITRLLVYDKITRFIREWFLQKREVTQDGAVYVEYYPYKRGPLLAVSELLQCPWCVGVWIAFFVVFGYFAFPWAWYIMLILAVAGVGSLLQIIGNSIGWRAENLKLEAYQKGSTERRL